MNSYYQNAVNDLKSHGKAKGLPSDSVVKNAPDGSSWKGKTDKGGVWSLTKHNETSYNAEF